MLGVDIRIHYDVSYIHNNIFSNFGQLEPPIRLFSILAADAEAVAKDIRQQGHYRKRRVQ